MGWGSDCMKKKGHHFTLMMSLPALFNLDLLCFLVIFIYTIFGMSKFAYIRKEARNNDTLNLETIGNNMICLFQIATYVGWNGLLAPILNSVPSNMTKRKRKKRSSRIHGDILFCQLHYHMLSGCGELYVAVILENLSVANEERAETTPLQ